MTLPFICAHKHRPASGNVGSQSCSGGGGVRVEEEKRFFEAFSPIFFSVTLKSRSSRSRRRSRRYRPSPPLVACSSASVLGSHPPCHAQQQTAQHLAAHTQQTGRDHDAALHAPSWVRPLESACIGWQNGGGQTATATPSLGRRRPRLRCRRSNRRCVRARSRPACEHATKEMMQTCLIYLHVISLVALPARQGKCRAGGASPCVHPSLPMSDSNTQSKAMR